MKDEKKITEENKSNESVKIFKKIIVVVISAICLIGSFFAGFVLRDVSDPDMASLKFIVETYKKYYLEESDDFVSIMGNSIIDRYSEYMTKEEYEAVVKGSAGRRKGIGIGYAQTTLLISTVNGNSPAQKAGIKEGDVIRAVKKSGEDNFTEVGNSDELSAVFSSIADDEEFSLKLDSSGGEKIITVARADYHGIITVVGSEDIKYLSIELFDIVAVALLTEAAEAVDVLPNLRRREVHPLAQLLRRNLLHTCAFQFPQMPIISRQPTDYRVRHMPCHPHSPPVHLLSWGISAQFLHVKGISI